MQIHCWKPSIINLQIHCWIQVTCCLLYLCLLPSLTRHFYFGRENGSSFILFNFHTNSFLVGRNRNDGKWLIKTECNFQAADLFHILFQLCERLVMFNMQNILVHFLDTYLYTEPSERKFLSCGPTQLNKQLQPVRRNQ